jgi:hypothetical protein
VRDRDRDAALTLLGALSIWSYARNFAKFFFASTFVIAAVSVVFPWSTCPIVPMFRCGLFRTNFSFGHVRCPLSCLCCL